MKSHICTIVGAIATCVCIVLFIFLIVFIISFDNGFLRKSFDVTSKRVGWRHIEHMSQFHSIKLLCELVLIIYGFDLLQILV